MDEGLTMAKKTKRIEQLNKFEWFLFEREIKRHIMDAEKALPKLDYMWNTGTLFNKKGELTTWHGYRVMRGIFLDS